MKPLSVIRKKWLYPILSYLYFNQSKRSFTEIKKALGLSTKVLADNLKVLQNLKLVERELRGDRTTWYKLTEKGKRMLELLSQIEKLLKE